MKLTLPATRRACMRHKPRDAWEEALMISVPMTLTTVALRRGSSTPLKASAVVIAAFVIS
eukprot:CAMPEP_0173106612 /NCGR_PEP_ID=MMETSP1102-20130122/41161_1 /TAXON_ID=49646 /ORGANISM="Geminigera sp., Strain Caron Lab Isolate" /LENGTH=59 /DNA_ID=CAMNT_0014003795 /DNA_START=71 /DNA_END=246 /DNA_ORIENTATION=-